MDMVFLMCQRNLTFVLIFLFLSGCSLNDDKSQSAPHVSRHIKSTLLARFSEDEFPEQYDPASKHSTPLRKKNADQPLFHVVLNKYGLGYAYVARVGEKYRIVHNGKKGKLYKSIDSGTLLLSPDGQRVAYGATDFDRKYMVVDNKEYGLYTEVARPVFSPDSKHIAFECKIGPREHLNIDGKLSPPVHSFFDYSHFSGDSTKIVYSVNGDNGMPLSIVVSDITFKNRVNKDTHGGSLEINPNGTKILTDEKNGNKVRLLEMSFTESSKIVEGPWYDSIQHFRYSENGKSIVFIGTRAGKQYMVLDGKEEKLPDSGGYTLPFTVRPDNKGVSIFMVNKDGVSGYLHHSLYNDGKSDKPFKEGGTLVYSSDGRQKAYIAVKNEKVLMVLNGVDGPPFDRVISPQFSPDGKYLVYRAKQAGSRFVVVVDTLSGNIMDKQPVYDMIYETVFSENGKSIEYGVQHNNELWWKVERL